MRAVEESIALFATPEPAPAQAGAGVLPVAARQASVAAAVATSEAASAWTRRGPEGSASALASSRPGRAGTQAATSALMVASA
jgi:hypothetical protein